MRSLLFVLLCASTCGCHQRVARGKATACVAQDIVHSITCALQYGMAAAVTCTPPECGSDEQHWVRLPVALEREWDPRTASMAAHASKVSVSMK